MITIQLILFCLLSIGMVKLGVRDGATAALEWTGFRWGKCGKRAS